MSRASGFTLLEVLVALAILGLAVVASIQGFAQGLRLLKLSGDHQRAAWLADRKAREIVTPVEEERESGVEGPFRWERAVTRVPTPELGEEASRRWRVWEIDVRVRWDERRLVEVTTRRTVPVETRPVRAER